MPDRPASTEPPSPDRPPRVSVVVPAWNAAATLGGCLDSLLALRFPREEMEIVVVDNASTDGTAALLDRYRGRVRAFHEARRGPSAARNRGLRHARGELVAFTDADCVVEADWLSLLIQPLEDPQVGIVGGRILPTTPYNTIEAFGTEIHDHRASITQFDPPYVITMNWASRRSDLLSAGGFDESLRRGEDVDLTYRILARGLRLAYVPEAIVRHRNERTLRGLFAEGWAHGYHSIAVNRKHEAFVKRGKAHRGWRRVVFWRVFGTGKLLGKLAGRIGFAVASARAARRENDAAARVGQPTAAARPIPGGGRSAPGPDGGIAADPRSPAAATPPSP
ncbi:MAG TPA: glycosyltransferase [Gemmatimonadota bacterium]